MKQALVFLVGLVLLAGAAAAATYGHDMIVLWIVGGLLTVGGAMSLLATSPPPGR